MRKLLFESEGFEVLTALDGATGLDLFATHKIDAVVLDYNMPSIDGITVAETLKKLRPALPIVMLTGYPVPASANQSIDALITKGESPALLLKTMASLLHIRSHPHRELEGKYVAFVDEKRCYLDVTDGVCQLLGYSRSELLKMRIDDVTAPAITSSTAPLFHRYLADGLQEGEYILLARGAKEIPINYIARVFPDGCMVARWALINRKPKSAPVEAAARGRKQA
jgi:CheY-like chemotaxis protein